MRPKSYYQFHALKSYDPAPKPSRPILGIAYPN